MNVSIDDLHIYTIGHSNLTIDMFINMLKFHKIKGIIDIRSVPYSRFHPQFNKEKLMDELKKADIFYLFKGDILGGRITDVTCYKSKALPNRKINIAELIDYDELSKRTWFNEGIQQLIELALSHRISVMCSEENPSRCHRSLLVSRRLLEKNFKVFHIRKDGRLDYAETEQSYTQMRLF